MFYKEIKKLKKSELQELLATTLQQKATLERANCSLTTELYKNIDDRDLEIDDLGHSLNDVSSELLEVETELVEVRASLIELDKENEESKIYLNDKYDKLNDWWSDRYNDLQNDIINTSQELLETEKELVNLRMENKIHLREKQEAREIAENYSLSNNKLRNELAEGSAPKNMYIHESNTIFVDSGELHIQADDDKTVVFNCSTLVQDLSIINDIVIKEAKKELSNNIQQIKSLTKDI